MASKYTWNGTAEIRTPSGVVTSGGTFTCEDRWLAQYPQRKWVQQGLIVRVKSTKKQDK
jgi:hypothetical protein